jgi:amidase
MKNKRMQVATDLAWLSAGDIGAKVRSGNLEPQAVVAVHLARIQRLDKKLHGYVHVDTEAQAGARGPLAGATVAVKDTQPVRGMPWTYGSPKWAGRIADRDAEPVSRAREAGAGILGKTNTPELAAAVGTVNELFPATENPWKAGVTPGGSSGGSAAVVAAGLATVAMGDDMGGSIRIPSSCCGVVGLRPQPGRVPHEIPDPTRLSVRGPIARSVADVRLLLEVMSAEPAPLVRRRPLRIALADSSTFGVDRFCQAAVERAAGSLELAGHRIKHVPWQPEQVAAAYRIVRPVTLTGYPGRLNEFSEGIRPMIQRGRKISGAEFYAAMRSGVAAASWLNELLAGEYDAILTPTLGALPMPIPEVPTFLGDGWDRYTQFVLPVSFAGLPAISIPAGRERNLPIGVQLICRHEWRLLSIAEELEQTQSFGFEPPPTYI